MSEHKQTKKYLNVKGFTLETEIANADIWTDARLPREMQARRLAVVYQRELSQKQKLYLGEFLAGNCQLDIAKKYNVCPSTVCRTIHRAFNRLRKYLRY